ncbi:hypothetical protein VDG1235_1871 [Verrucomicrobiia bacterium DG1235]|nr:hypothetical protein VDG1235_1871 [Verrucomicrobiae bacterium DG1235]
MSNEAESPEWLSGARSLWSRGGVPQRLDGKWSPVWLSDF